MGDIESIEGNDTLTFASIEAILADENTESQNPWVQTHKSLNSIQASNDRVVKAEEKRQKKLREMWKDEMHKKSEIHPEMAGAQKSIKYWGTSLGAIAGGAPFFGLQVANGLVSLAQKTPLNRFLQALDQKTIKDFVGKVPDLVNGVGQTTLNGYAQERSFFHKDKLDLAECSSQLQRNLLDQQQQLIQEEQQTRRSLEERHLEIIKTLTAQVTGRG